MLGGGTTIRYLISELGDAEFVTLIDQLAGVYAAAMNAPREQLDGRRMIMSRHAGNPGFAALIAACKGEIAGFCYGFHGEPGQWWHDRVRAALSDKHWLEDSFEVAELHVLPEHQGHGVGSTLLRRIAAGRQERTVALSTKDADTPARRLYRKLGFTDLLTGYRFDGTEPAFAIMAAPLPLAAPSPSA